MLVAKFTTENLMGVLMKHLHAPALAIKRKFAHTIHSALHPASPQYDWLLNMYKWKIKWEKLVRFKLWTLFFFFSKKTHIFRPCLGHHVQAEVYKVLPFTFQFCSNKCHYKSFRTSKKKLLMCFLHVNQFNMGIVMLTLLYTTAFIISHSYKI